MMLRAPERDALAQPSRSLPSPDPALETNGRSAFGRCAPSRRASLKFLCLALPLVVAACAESTPAPVSFAPLRYTYLPLLRLNVATIAIQNAWQPDMTANHLESLSPETPLTALRQMAKDRLAAAGDSGRAVFTITDASIVGDGGELTGSFAVRLNVSSGDGLKSGFAEAHTTRTVAEPATEGPELRAALYDLVRTMMQTMNVDFEYQLRRSLGSWLVAADGAANPAGPSSIEAQPLAAPGTTAPAPTPAAPTPLAPPAPTSIAPSPPAAPGTPALPEGVLGTMPMPLHSPGTP